MYNVNKLKFNNVNASDYELLKCYNQPTKIKSILLMLFDDFTTNWHSDIEFKNITDFIEYVKWYDFVDIYQYIIPLYYKNNTDDDTVFVNNQLLLEYATSLVKNSSDFDSINAINNTLLYGLFIGYCTALYNKFNIKNGIDLYKIVKLTFDTGIFLIDEFEYTEKIINRTYKFDLKNDTVIVNNTKYNCQAY